MAGESEDNNTFSSPSIHSNNDNNNHPSQPTSSEDDIDLFDTQNGLILKKRKLLIDDKVLQLPVITQSIIEQEISKSVIDKYWTQLNPDATRTLENIIEMGIITTIKQEHLTKSSNKFLNNLWLNSQNSKSFKSKLSVTKLPHPRSQFTKNADNRTNEIKDPLNYDEIIYKRKILQSYLDAEQKQVVDLEYNLNELDQIYWQDLRYLKNYQDVTGKFEREINTEIRNKLKQLEFDEEEVEQQKDDKLKLNLIKSETTKFDPDKDQDIKEILNQLSYKLSDISSNVESLVELNNKLEILNNLLN
ncbi:unnamed protein product [Candida verbasci]|uniref:Uncharacterized protein n=1 Tax=Candida verbasci TaxID=1227364 RepID=A0A9W4TSQ5_9ASCO|nr:unnamed protein product [Candida verbasci]